MYTADDPSVDRSIAAMACIVVSLALMPLEFLSLPSSGAPSTDQAIVASVVFWATAMLTMVTASATLAERTAQMATVIAACGAGTVAIGWWVGSRFARANLDSCDYGTGSGDRPECIPRAADLPGYKLAWIVAAVAITLIALFVSRAARRSHAPRQPVAAD